MRSPRSAVSTGPVDIRTISGIVGSRSREGDLDGAPSAWHAASKSSAAPPSLGYSSFERVAPVRLFVEHRRLRGSGVAALGVPKSKPEPAGRTRSFCGVSLRDQPGRVRGRGDRTAPRRKLPDLVSRPLDRVQESRLSGSMASNPSRAQLSIAKRPMTRAMAARQARRRGVEQDLAAGQPVPVPQRPRRPEEEGAMARRCHQPSWPGRRSGRR